MGEERDYENKCHWCGIAWVKNEATIEDKDAFIEELQKYAYRMPAILNDNSGNIIICFGDKRTEILLFNQHEISIGDEIKYKNEQYKVIKVSSTICNGNFLQVVDWK